MKDYFNVHNLWIIMLMMTFFAYGLGKLEFGGIATVSLLLSTALLKGYIIIADFMEVRGVSLAWRVILYGWLWITCITIAITYLVSANV